MACTDPEGELVTSIVAGRDCVFAYHEGGCCFCALERACSAGLTSFRKPMSCALYPLREKAFANGTVGLNYHRWEVCRPAVAKGRALGLPLYRFLAGPLRRRFGDEWYGQLLEAARMLGL